MTIAQIDSCPETETMEVPAPSFLVALRRARILTPRRFEEVRREILGGAGPRDPLALARRLVKRGVLTQYQARRLLHEAAPVLNLGRYVILDRLGRGSMGRVFRARHRLMDREVALKLVAPGLVGKPTALARFKREIRFTGRFDHPNVVRALDADMAGSTPYLVLEYVPGESLDRRLLARGPLAIAEVIGLAAQAADGLAHVHDRGVVHRDLKPANLLLGEDGRLLILDFGVATLERPSTESRGESPTEEGRTVGTVDYMSPEQACGQVVDRRSDLYSLGCVIYHLLAGEIPFPASSATARLAKRFTGTQMPLTDHRPDVHADLSAVVDRLMRACPEDRYQDAAEVAADLRAIAGRRGDEAEGRGPDWSAN